MEPIGLNQFPKAEKAMRRLPRGARRYQQKSIAYVRRSSWWLVAAAWSIVLLVASVNANADTRKPNFILIFIDDMGYGDIEPFGSTRNRTPNLNRMAREGMKLTSFYAAPVCSASRAQLLTGCYAPRVSVPGVFFPAGSKGLNPEEKTVAEYLKEQGYSTACVGKWHLGDQPDFLPTRQGFDSYYGIPYSNDMQRRSATDGRSVTPLLRNERVEALLEDEGQRMVTRQYTTEAVSFIKSHKHAPFFLYMPHTAMHVPIYPHRDFAGKSDNGRYGDWVSEVDWSVGQILDSLNEEGLSENTLVVFTSDNGPWASKGRDGGVAGPLRGSKGCTLEGGVREPTIAWWPGRVKAGSSSDQIAGTTDVLPTFVNLAGGAIDPDRRIDGVDLSSLLLGTSQHSGRDVWHYFRGMNLEAVRFENWKLAIAPQSIGMGFRESPADLQKKEPRLYNLAEDIGETTDIANQHPDVVRRLLEEVSKMRDDIGSGKPGPGVRPAGSVASPVTLYATLAKQKKSNVKPIPWKRIKPGDTYPSSRAPRIQMRGFCIKCNIDLEPSAAADGLIVAHGGSAVGYSLYIRNGELTFAVRQTASRIERTSIKIPNSNELRISAQLDGEGQVSVTVNGQMAESKVKGLLPRHPQEDLCISSDNGNPVDTAAPENGVRGNLISLNIEADRS